uniref:Coiled-coil domain-containing protein 108 n=1 Tax=Timema monikensis TaxID=170555 RepID=A0A7R9EIQ2_9NEOP|nr:unnamed protein product [Timema monikensis]
MVERSHEPPLYYRQLTMTRKQRRELTSQLDTIPPHFLAERILNDIIFQAIREKCEGMSLEDARLTPGTTGTYRAANISLTPPYSELQREFDYEIQRDPATNPLGHVFDVEPYCATVPPGQNFVFKVKFAPKFPSAVCVDYFTVLGPDGVKLILTVRGCSKGPSVQTSTHKMVFLCLGGKTSASNILVLNNESDVPAAFQFDVDKTQSVFQVGETTGTLKPRGALYVTVKFVPLSPGIFVQKLACLVLYQVAEPLLIEAVGVSSDSENISPERLSLTSHWEHCPLEGSYERYMDDCSRVAKNTPELSLSEAYLDFGQAEVGTTDAPLAFSLTSHVDDDIILEWDQGSSGHCGSAGYVPDKNKVFHIDPPSTLVPAWRSVLFQVYFRPHTTDLLYSAKLEGRAYRGTHETRQKMEFPLETWISVMGHSFGPNSKMWVPQYKLSHQTVVLPACIPSVPVYTTFLIKRFGHLPLMFKFLPPNISNYTVKPSQGVIDTDYQIVVVQLCPESLQETAYVERWGLEFNKSPDQEVGNPLLDVPFDSVPSNYTVKPSQGVIDTDYQIVVVQLCPESLQETAYVERWGLEFNKSPDQEVSVYFRAYAEHPSLEIGKGNIVLLPPNFPGCEEIVNVPIRNLSRHCVRFGFKPCNTTNDVTILDSEGTISANELVHSQWSFRMSSVGFTYVQFICQVWVLQQGLYPAGVPTEYIVTGYGESERAEIVAEPKHLDFGESQCGDLKVGRFIVINSSRCPIHFLFRCVNFELGNTPTFQDIKLNPTWGSIPKNKSIELTVSVRTNLVGFQTLSIYCDVRKSVHSSEVVWRSKIFLAQVSYEVLTPKLEITDISSTGGGLVLSKADLWEILQLDKFRVIERPQGSAPFLMHLLLKNCSNISTHWELRRHKECRCRQLIKDHRISFRDGKIHCPHRQLFNLQPLRGTLKPKEEQVLTLNVQYAMEGEFALSYILRLCEDRQVKLTALLNVTPGNQLSLVTSTKHMRGIYLGELRPPAESVYIYNSSCQPLDYKVDTSPLASVSGSKDILTCLNPTGSLAPETCHPLLFRCTPTQLTNYEATLDVVLGARSVTLKLTCEGVVDSSRQLVSRAPHSKRLTDEAPVSISTCHIVLEPFLTHNASQYLFFITNHMASAVYQYTWARCEVEGVAQAWVRPHRGTLPSGESHACCLTVHSLGTSAVLPLNLTCELLELDTLSSCERSDLLVKEVTRRMEEFTTIDNITCPMPDAEEPLPWHQVLMVSCDIVSPTDANLKISLLRQSPGTELYLNINYYSQVLPPSLANLMKHILEGMIWVIVSSDWFSRSVIRSNKEPTPYYSQFVLNDNEHEKLIQQSYVSPTHGLAGDMLRDIIYHLILQEFHLDTVPHSINTDDLGAVTFLKVE